MSNKLKASNEGMQMEKENEKKTTIIQSIFFSFLSFIFFFHSFIFRSHISQSFNTLYNNQRASELRRLSANGEGE